LLFWRQVGLVWSCMIFRLSSGTAPRVLIYHSFKLQSTCMMAEENTILIKHKCINTRSLSIIIHDCYFQQCLSSVFLDKTCILPSSILLDMSVCRALQACVQGIEILLRVLNTVM